MIDFSDSEPEVRVLHSSESESSSSDSSSNSDSEDELFLKIAVRGRVLRNIRPRVNHFEIWSSREFVLRFRLTRPTVLQLLQQVENELVTQTDRNSSVSPINQLLLTLRFSATGCLLISAGDFSGIHKSTAGVIVKRVTIAIGRLCKQYVKFASTAAELKAVKDGFHEQSNFPGVIGAIGCTHVKLQSPGGENAEAFRNRKNYFSLNVQTISDPRLRIQNIVARWPGSCHDNTIFSKSDIRARLENGEFGDGLLVGDSGYTLESYMITPLRNPVLEEEVLFNEALTRTRNVVERLYGVWKRRFPVLYLRIRLAVETAQDIIVACAVLHNLAIDQKEAEPPIDPELPPLNVEDGQMPLIAAAEQGDGTDAVQRTLVEHFRKLL